MRIQRLLALYVVSIHLHYRVSASFRPRIPMKVLIASLAPQPTNISLEQQIPWSLVFCQQSGISRLLLRCRLNKGRMNGIY